MKSFLVSCIVLLICLCAAEIFCTETFAWNENTNGAKQYIPKTVKTEFEDKFDDILKTMKAYFDIRITQLKDTIGDFLPLRILCFP